MCVQDHGSIYKVHKGRGKVGDKLTSQSFLNRQTAELLEQTMVNRLKLVVLFAMALVAFAGNSILNRYALLEPAIDPASFLVIRIVSGAVMLVLLVWLRSFFHRPQKQPYSKGSWWGALTLSWYAIAFSYAYVELQTGFGALVLFTAVQLSMLAITLYQGTRLSRREWLGVVIAFAGFVYLLVPSMQLPSSLLAAMLMAGAGVAWGFYSVHGRGRGFPLANTAFNFVRAIPFVLIAFWWQAPELIVSTDGVMLAMVSGAITSGVGYAIWYLVLPQITVTTAAIGQLLVPLIAALGGVLFAHEVLTMHLLIAAVAIIGGILVVVLKRT